MTGLLTDFGLDNYTWANDLDTVKLEVPRVVEGLGTIAVLIGEATAEIATLEASYRHWRSVYMADTIERDRKMSEWKARVTAESQSLYVSHHNGIVEAVERLEQLKGIQIALLAKRDMIVAILAS